MSRDKATELEDFFSGYDDIAPTILLDLFAGWAMQSMTSGPGARMVADRDERYNEDNWAEIVASNAYTIAAAMLVERAKRKGGAS